MAHCGCDNARLWQLQCLYWLAAPLQTLEDAIRNITAAARQCDESLQRKLLDVCNHHPLGRSLLPPPSFKLKYLKLLVAAFERNREGEVVEELYDEIGRLLLHQVPHQGTTGNDDSDSNIWMHHTYAFLPPHMEHTVSRSRTLGDDAAISGAARSIDNREENEMRAGDSNGCLLAEHNDAGTADCVDSMSGNRKGDRTQLPASGACGVEATTCTASRINDVVGGQHDTTASMPILDGVTTVTVRVSSNMLQGDTGCTVWPASLVLSDFLLSHPSLIRHMSCLELGSGAGLLGLLLSSLPSSLVLTDGSTDSLLNLSHNLTLNGISHQILSSPPPPPTDALHDLSWVVKNDRQVSILHLPWEQPDEALTLLPDCRLPRVILAADVVYDPSCLPALTGLLHRLLSQPVNENEDETSGSRNRDGVVGDDAGCESCDSVHAARDAGVGGGGGVFQYANPFALIASTVRNRSTLAAFVRQLEGRGLCVRNVSHWLACNGNWDDPQMESNESTGRSTEAAAAMDKQPAQEASSMQQIKQALPCGFPSCFPSCCALSQNAVGVENVLSNECCGRRSESACVDGVGEGKLFSWEGGGMLEGHTGRCMRALQHALVSKDHEVCLHLIWKMECYGQ